MKNLIYFLILSLLFLYHKSFGQIPVEADTNICKSYFDSLLGRDVFLFVDSFPSPEGGIENLIDKIGKIVGYKSVSKSDNIGSLTVVSFIIDETGKIVGQKIEREDFKGMDLPDQLFKIIESVKWFPGSCNGKKVPVQFKLPLRICLK